jgi:hypothetical protein
MNAPRSHRRSALSLCLAFAVGAGALGAACGGAPTTPAVPPTPSSTAPVASSASMPETPAPTASASATPPAPTASATPPIAEPSGPTESVALGPSEMLADLKAAKVDLTKDRDLGKLPIDKKKAVMRLFVKALGMKGCEGCHVEHDFKADTTNKLVAAQMWNHFVRDLRMKGGQPIFCDSCHHGHEELLARGDRKALSKFMRENYEAKLERSDKKEHNCETCHGDPFEGEIFEKVWKVPAVAAK